MGKLVIVRPLVPNAVSASLETAGGPAANLAKALPADKWVASASAANVTIDIDLGSAIAVDCLALLFSNASAAAQITWTAAATQGGLAAPAFTLAAAGLWASPGVITAKRHSFSLLAAPETWRWWRADIADAGTVLEAGNVVLGPAFQPEHNHAHASPEGSRDMGTRTRLSGGPVLPRQGVKLPRARFDLKFLTRGERFGYMRELTHFTGTTEALLVCLDAGDAANRHEMLYWGALERDIEITPRNRPFATQRFRIENLGGMS